MPTHTFASMTGTRGEKVSEDMGAGFREMLAPGLEDMRTGFRVMPAPGMDEVEIAS